MSESRSFPADESVGLLMNQTPAASPAESIPDAAPQPSPAAATVAAPQKNLPADGGGGDAEDAIDPAQQVMSLLKPVTLTMVLVVLLVHEMKEASTQISGTFSDLMVYQEDASDSAGTILSGVLLNGLAIVGMLFVVTTGLLLLYKGRCYLIIYGWFFMSVSTLLFGFGGYILQELLTMHDIPFDSPSFLFIMWNVSAVGTLLIFWTEFGFGAVPPLELQQGYLILISALLAWSATKTPEWTTWGLLAAVSIWDLIAVLTPRGPLKLLVEEAEARGEPIPGLVYQGSDIKLGLGDFIFYSILVGRASMRGSAALLACAVAVLAGLCATLALLPILQRVLPALPISIAVGILFYFTSSSMLIPMANAAAVNHLFL